MIMLWVLCLSSSVSVAASKSLVFGYSRDGRPVSYPGVDWSGETGGVKGFCQDVALFLHHLGYQIELQPLKFDERFKWFADHYLQDHQPGIQCGPSSRTRQRQLQLNQVNGVFSMTFAVTSTKLLIRKEKVAALHPVPYAETTPLKIGVLESEREQEPTSVTSLLIRQVIPNATIIGLRRRQEAIDRLKADTLLENGAVNEAAIDAYASDEIILTEMLHVDNKDELGPLRENYVIAPEGHGYSLEEYALVLFNAPPELMERVNAWLLSAEGQAAAARFQRAGDALTDPLQKQDVDIDLPVVRIVLMVLGIALMLFLLWRYRHRWVQEKVSLVGDTALPAEAEPADVHQTPESDGDLEPREKEKAVEQAPVLPAVRLTNREIEVLALLDKGLLTKQIAAELKVADRTVDVYRSHLRHKLGGRNVVELLNAAREQGFLDP